MNVAEILWGKKANINYLLIASTLILFSGLGVREIWTQEHRWADIVSAMFYYHDFLHPTLNGHEYYDKPLLSYWLIAGISLILGDLNTWALRLPSAFAGLFSVCCIYRLGSILKSKSFGLLAGWMLLTTFFFIFWARTSSADMLNIAGTLASVTWYFEKKNDLSFFNYAIFFLILTLTALCKGLVGPVVVFLVLLPDFIARKQWKSHLNLNFLLAIIPAIFLYILPFAASSYFNNNSYHQNGLYLVYKENILRYFQPFDHKGPIYEYFISLPLYMIPWTLFFIPALISLKSRWKNMNESSRWLVWAVFILFLFFTFSGSRRNYYILPVVPFAILMTADWILNYSFSKYLVWASRLTMTAFIMFMLGIGCQYLYYTRGGIPQFSTELKQSALEKKPWPHWNFVLLDPEVKISFYLKLSPEIKNYSISNQYRKHINEINPFEIWPILKNLNQNTILISRKTHEVLLDNILQNYTKIEAKKTLGQKIFCMSNKDLLIAYVPKS